jgi:hypothetical protein
MIVGVVYTLVVGSFESLKDKGYNLKLENLKEYLKSYPNDDSVELLCLNDCSSCDILVDGNKSASIDNFLDSSIKIYRYEFLYGYRIEEKKLYINNQNVEQDICFSYKIDKNMVGNQILVEYKNKFYDFTPYFSGAIIYDSISAASEAKENLYNEVMQ